MVLADGFGSRLKPFTEANPKPLFPFFGISLLELGLFRLRDAGITSLSANAHHLASVLELALKSSPLGQGVKLSIEKPEILGRGGAFVPLKTWRNGSDLLVYNGDIASDVNVEALLKAHKVQQNIATMMLLPKPLGRDSAVYRVGDRIVAISKSAPEIVGATPHGFACLHILTEEFLALLPQSGVSDVLEGYQTVFTKGLRVGNVIHEGFWHGIETPQNAWEAHLDLFQRGFESEAVGIRQIFELKRETFTFVENKKSLKIPAQILGPVFIGPRSNIDPSAVVGPNVVISGDARIAENSEIKNSLLLNGVEILAGEKIENSVVGFDGGGRRVTIQIK